MADGVAERLIGGLGRRAAPLVRRAAGRTAPNLATAVWLYAQLRRQSRSLARAGRDERSPAELVRTSADGALLLIADHDVIDVRIGVEPVTAIQKQTEIMALLDEVAALRPSCVCELGTAAGGTLYLLSRVCPDTALLVSVDLVIPLHTQIARARMARGRQRVVSVSGDSHAAETKAEVERYLAGRPLDFLLIDGDHSYEGVSRDFELYAPLVRQGGLIALHDIHSDFGSQGSSISGDVPQFWRELQGRYRTRELIADPEQNGYGIGLVYA